MTQVLNYFVSSDPSTSRHPGVTPITTIPLTESNRPSDAPYDLVEKFGADLVSEFEDEVAEAIEHEGAGADPSYFRFFDDGDRTTRHTIYWWVTPVMVPALSPGTIGEDDALQDLRRAIGELERRMDRVEKTAVAE